MKKLDERIAANMDVALEQICRVLTTKFESALPRSCCIVRDMELLRWAIS
jgi:hypothetical protein